jgi:hypothetical protein
VLREVVEDTTWNTLESPVTIGLTPGPEATRRTACRRENQCIDLS